MWSAADDPIITLVPAQKGLVGIRQQFGEPLDLLMAAVGIILLIDVRMWLVLRWRVPPRGKKKWQFDWR